MKKKKREKSKKKATIISKLDKFLTKHDKFIGKFEFTGESANGCPVLKIEIVQRPSSRES